MASGQHLKVDESPERSPGAGLHSLLLINAPDVVYLNSVHGRGQVLFAEGEPARGVYILRAGSAAVSISSSEGRVITLRVALAGDVLGLNAVLRNCACDTTVKMLETSRTDFIPRAELMQLMGTSQSGTQTILNILSQELTELTYRTRSLLLPQTARARLAQLMLDWSKKSVRIERGLTHEEIGQMICSSRETVTRLLASMSRNRIIQITSDCILIRDCAALERMAMG